MGWAVLGGYVILWVVVFRVWWLRVLLGMWPTYGRNGAEGSFGMGVGSGWGGCWWMVVGEGCW